MAGASPHLGVGDAEVKKPMDEYQAEVIREVADTFCQLSSLPLNRPKTCFDTHSVPPISIRDYVERLWKYMDCSLECYVISVAYIQRILVKHPDIRIGILNAHTLAFGSIIVAAKFHEDIIHRNSFYARVGGVSTAALATLEVNFLKLLDWQASITPQEFQRSHDLLFCPDRRDRLSAICRQQMSTASGTESEDSAQDLLDDRQEKQEDKDDNASACSCSSNNIESREGRDAGKVLRRKSFYRLPADSLGSSSTVCSLDDAQL